MFQMVMYRSLVQLCSNSDPCSVSAPPQETHHEPQVSSFLQDHGNLYQDVKSIGPEEEMDAAATRNLGL